MAKTRKSRTNQNTLQNKVKPLEAKTENQKNYIRSIVENDIVFCTGPSGCGKSYCAAGIASYMLHAGDYSNILVTRPLVCTGKDVGSLPGELMEKIGPYMTPMQENLRTFLGQSLYGYYYNERAIRFEALEVMRGATFNNTIMILDEAQNCTKEQIKMFVTRMGEDSKVLINGDIKQTDLREKSGLLDIINRVSGIKGIDVCELSYSDIQRNGLLGDFLNAVEND